jgi:hypothetical protein
MMTKSLQLNLKLVYQLTHRMMICPSKCRPLNNASTRANRCILSSSPDRALFAPEPAIAQEPSSPGASLNCIGVLQRAAGARQEESLLKSLLYQASAFQLALTATLATASSFC